MVSIHTRNLNCLLGLHTHSLSILLLSILPSFFLGITSFVPGISRNQTSRLAISNFHTYQVTDSKIKRPRLQDVSSSVPNSFQTTPSSTPTTTTTTKNPHPISKHLSIVLSSQSTKLERATNKYIKRKCVGRESNPGPIDDASYGNDGFYH
jgi:hypothetical protein